MEKCSTRISNKQCICTFYNISIFKLNAFDIVPSLAYICSIWGVSGSWN